MSAPRRIDPGHTLARRAALLCALPACTVDPTQDFTESFLVLEPVERIEIAVDKGSLTAITYDRANVSLKRHTFGFTSQLGPADYSLESGVMRFEAHCIRTDHCTWDHMFELPPGVGFDLQMGEAVVSLGRIDGDITAQYEFGRFKANRLRSQHVTISAGDSPITLDFSSAPESVTIDLVAGDVSLSVPPGSYRCNFAAGAGEVRMSDITCDDAAANVLDVQVGAGDITLAASTPE